MSIIGVFIAKKKLSAYNLHVRREMKAGKTMKQAAKSWSKTAGKPKTRKKSVRKTAKKKKSGKRGSRILGNIGLKGALMGGAALVAANLLIPPIGGVYDPAIKKVAAGTAARAIGISGASLAGAGLIEAAAITIAGLISGKGLSLGSGNSGGYDY